jgi:ABC-type nitrate/sulfonate/bicarbonate transport system substrate-binding protein
VLADGTQRVLNQQFYLARRGFAERSDDLLRPLMQALQHTGRYIAAQPREAARHLSNELGLASASLELALSRRSHEVRAMDLQVIRQQQSIADRFYALGLLPRAIAVREAVWPM